MTQEINLVRLVIVQECILFHRVTIFNYYICEKLAEFALNNIVIVVNGYGVNSLGKFTGGSPLCELAFLFCYFRHVYYSFEQMFLSTSLRTFVCFIPFREKNIS